MNSQDSKNTQKYSFDIKLDSKLDADNWYVGCNRVGLHGTDFQKLAPEDVYKKINGKSKEEAIAILIPFLEQKYIDESQFITDRKALVIDRLEHKFSVACNKVAELSGKPLYRNDFTFVLTTFPRGSYNYELGYIWLPIQWIEKSDIVKLFMHELLHFQFIHYWRLVEGSDVNKLSDEKFEYLKESLTVILDENVRPLIFSPDKGYEKHRLMRNELHEYWKKYNDFSELVKFGLSRLDNFVNK